VETALSAAGPASVPQDEQVEILTEQLRGTQEELAVTQDELARTQEELHWTNEELQTLNQEMLEMTADRNDHVPARLQELPAWKTVAETSARAVVSKHQVELLLQQSGLLHTENRQLVCQARAGIAQLRAACLLVEPGGPDSRERNSNGNTFRKLQQMVQAAHRRAQDAQTQASELCLTAQTLKAT